MSTFADVRGKVAVVTGGASGIGLGIATRLREAGARVVLADIEREPLEKAAADLGALGVVTDVRDHGSVAALAEKVVDHHGAVHLVVNNAGVGPMADRTDDHGRLAVDHRRQPLRRHPRRERLPAPAAGQPRRRAHRQHRVERLITLGAAAS